MAALKPEARSSAARPGIRLVAEGLTCGYAPGPPLLDVDLVAESGQPCVLTGRSGIGRSTLAQALAGFMPRLTGGWRRGRVTLGQPDGQELDQARVAPADWLAHVGWYGAPPRSGLTGARRTVLGEVAFGLEQRGVGRDGIARRAGAMLEAIGLAALAARDPRTLSDGETARLALGGILIHQPEALVLDDPEAYLDGAGLRDLLGLVAGAGERIVVLATARPAALAEAHSGWLATSRALVLDDGRVVERGDAEAVLSAARLLDHGVLPYLRLPGTAPQPGATTMAAERRSEIDRHADALAMDAASWDVLASEAALGAIETTDLVVAFDEAIALRGVTFRAAAGSVTALIGANGGGKTTLLRALAGLVAPTGGRVRTHGPRPAEAGRRVRAPRVVLVGSRPEDQPAARTVRADVALGLRWSNVPRARHDAILEAGLAVAGLTGVADEHPHEVPASARRWRSIAAALVLRSPVILLDEPTVGLDGAGQLRLEAAIAQWRREGRTVVLASHDLDFVAEVADRVVVLAGGRVLADGALADVLGETAVLAAARLVPPSRLAVAAALAVPAHGTGSRAALRAALDRRQPADGLGGPRYNVGPAEQEVE